MFWAILLAALAVTVFVGGFAAQEAVGELVRRWSPRWEKWAGGIFLGTVLVLGIVAAASSGFSLAQRDDHPHVHVFARTPTATATRTPTLTPPRTADPSATPTETAVASVTSSPTAELPSSVTIDLPEDGDSVDVGVDVQGRSSGVISGRSIYVLVRPIPSDPNQEWFVQPAPSLAQDGSWVASVFVGIESDPEGLPFDICAIVTTDLFAQGDRLPQLPDALSRDCISVTR